ncbi:hypothetical protein [Pelagicoccus mobilis]|uniref:Uncharacterized protein n=1 Tax=Pelagicoccus mobilis TaxID=415221 RepID=A0A934RXW6_9BACT|nr:hypothetical protein [Pelagicoccus mobilis]MBK1877259.1 hypothetical protein [Pelagicoccus mobilis]
MPTICNPEEYTYEDASQRAFEEFSAENRPVFEETVTSEIHQELARMLPFVDGDDEETVVFRKYTIKIVEDEPIAGLLLKIEAAFGMNVTQLAGCLKASRQGIYDWRKDRSLVGRPEHRQRSERLVELADRWWSKVGAPVSRKLRNAVIGDGQTICDVLASDDLNQPDVESALDRLAELALSEKRARKVAKGASGRQLGDILELANG